MRDAIQVDDVADGVLANLADAVTGPLPERRDGKEVIVAPATTTPYALNTMDVIDYPTR